MKAIILSAGQGSRLLPLTENTPKCLLPIDDETLLEKQVHALYQVGVREIVVVTGFCAGAVEHCMAGLDRPGLVVRCAYNPFFNVADNLASCWMIRGEMDTDFVLVNGDTLFDPAVCAHLLAAPLAPVNMAIDIKNGYDADDMKVRVDGTRLLEVGKTLAPDSVHGESIGMLRFSADGAREFATVVNQIMRTPNSLGWWYLKAVGVLAERGLVRVESVHGLRWGEVDFPRDLERARALFADPAPSRGAAALRRAL